MCNRDCNLIVNVENNNCVAKLVLTRKQFLELLGDGAKPAQLTVTMEVEVSAETGVEADEATKVIVKADKAVELGDYVTIRERKKKGKFINVLYQYVCAPDGRRGLLRAHPLGDECCFNQDGSDVYAESEVKKRINKWAVKQHFDAFVEEVSLLELPGRGYDDRAQNGAYILSLKLTEGLGEFWTKTPYLPLAGGNTSGVWMVQADCHLVQADRYSVQPNDPGVKHNVVPVLWLKPDVLIDGGRGTRESPHSVILVE